MVISQVFRAIYPDTAEDEKQDCRNLCGNWNPEESDIKAKQAHENKTLQAKACSLIDRYSVFWGHVWNIFSLCIFASKNLALSSKRAPWAEELTSCSDLDLFLWYVIPFIDAGMMNYELVMWK